MVHSVSDTAAVRRVIVDDRPVDTEMRLGDTVKVSPIVPAGATCAAASRHVGGAAVNDRSAAAFEIQLGAAARARPAVVVSRVADSLPWLTTGVAATAAAAAIVSSLECRLLAIVGSGCRSCRICVLLVRPPAHNTITLTPAQTQLTHQGCFKARICTISRVVDQSKNAWMEAL